MFIFLIWWCIDDALATALNMPEIGRLPWVLVLLACLILAPGFRLRGEVRP